MCICILIIKKVFPVYYSINFIGYFPPHDFVLIEMFIEVENNGRSCEYVFVRSCELVSE